jgi:hypothetical protein
MSIAIDYAYHLLSRYLNSAAFFISQLVSGVIYHAEGSEERRYLRAEAEDGFVDAVERRLLSKINET